MPRAQEHVDVDGIQIVWDLFTVRSSEEVVFWDDETYGQKQVPDFMTDKYTHACTQFRLLPYARKARKK